MSRRNPQDGVTPRGTLAREALQHLHIFIADPCERAQIVAALKAATK